MAESAKARALFEEYCALGPERSLAKLAAKYGKKASYVRQLERWSSEHQWVERAKQYDAERAEEKRHKQEAELERMNERHAMIGTTQQSKAIKQVEELIAAKKFGSQATVQLLKLATDLERLARGAATERQELTGKDGGPIRIQPVDYSQLSDEDLAVLEQLARKAVERGNS